MVGPLRRPLWVRELGPTRLLFFVLGACLFSVNLWGLTKTLRAKDLDRVQLHPGDVVISPSELRQQSPRRVGEEDAAYIVRLTLLLNRGMAHYWGEEVDRYRLRVPLWENYLLWAASYVLPGTYRKYEFAQPDKALERGVGLCSQQSVALARLLQRSGIDAQLQGLEGHVVVRATDRQGRNFLADPDYGAVIPHSITVVERDPQIIRAYYRIPYLEEQTLDALTRIYGPEGNREWTVPEYFYGKFHYAEHAAYVLKWVFPLILLLPPLVHLRKVRNG